MPTYTYECKDCGHRYDNFQSISAAADTECPECKGRVERVIGGGVGIVFKGSGFYVTDYKKDSGSSSGASSSNAASSPGSSASGTGGASSGSSPASSGSAASSTSSGGSAGAKKSD
ncbi:MAG: hypothetical protein NXI24_13930 [bacterium]|nr:hypothetical protein [bacterium]